MTDHIILTAFGTTTRAKESYLYLEKHIGPRFRDCRIHWAFSSPTVRKRSAPEDSSRPASITEIINSLDDPGKIVVQSLHVLPGHEYDRIKRESEELPVSVSVGLPLLSDKDDFNRVCQSLKPLIENTGHDAVLIFAHGTDHPCQTAFAQLQTELRNQIDRNIHVTTLEMGLEPAAVIIERLVQAGCTKVFGIPFLMVAGMHFLRDIGGHNETSWLYRLNRKQINLDLHNQGLAVLPGIGDIFCDHILSAFDSA